MKNNQIIIAVILAAVFAGGGFFAGMQYQKSRPSQNNQAGANGQRRFSAGQNGANRPVSGDIISSDEKSITVKMQDGSSKIVLVSDSTQINKAAQASKADLKTGERVAVFGTTNSDGSVTAQNIQLNPQTRGFGGNQGTPSGVQR